MTDPRPFKPRPYNGPVGWLAEADDFAGSWSTMVRASVQAYSPYLQENPTGVRPDDWLKLVAHVSLRRGELPIACAERLAMYVRTYREAHQKTLSPTVVRDTQERIP